MDPKDRKKIEDYYDLLVEKTNFKQVYTFLLRATTIPTHLKAFKNVANLSNTENNKILYDIIKYRGRNAFTDLKAALKLSNPDLFDQFQGKKWSLQGVEWHHLPEEYDLSSEEITGQYRVVSFSDCRDGWKTDVKNLEDTFTDLGFKGSKCIDPEKMEEMFDGFTNVHNAGCYVFALAGHGNITTDGEVFRQTDGSYKSIKDVLLEICNAPALLNKPKIIILQLCRGTAESFSYTRLLYTSPDLPSIKDTIILRPCLPGYVAYRDTDSGSWFIDVLTKKIKEYAKTKDIEEIMVQVCDEFAKKRKNKTEFYAKNHESRYMVPCTYTYSFKKFYFVTREKRERD